MTKALALFRIGLKKAPDGASFLAGDITQIIATVRAPLAKGVGYRPFLSP